jgi:heme/copper-type cytochrome/quinol oxidase subunit 3
MNFRELIEDKYRLVMLFFLASEAIFFAFLITAYVYFHGAVKGGGPDAHNSLELLTTGIYTVILLSSSATMHLAGRAYKRKRSSISLWLGITIACGVIFLYGEMSEYMRLLHRNVTISRNLFGSTYYTLTGFHAAHVTVGLILLSFLLLMALQGNLMPGRSSGMETVSYYWHFVDIVWIAVFSTVYLWSTR